MRQSNVWPECEYQNVPPATPGPCATGFSCASFWTSGSESRPTLPAGSTDGPAVCVAYAAGTVVSPRSQCSSSAISTSGRIVDTGRTMRATSERPVDPLAAAAAAAGVGSGCAVSSTTTCGVVASFTLLVFMRCAIEYPPTNRYPVANNNRNGNAPHSPTYRAYTNAAAV